MFVEEKKEDVTFRETGTAYETKDDSLVAEYEAELGSKFFVEDIWN